MTDRIDIDHLRGWIGREETIAETLAPALVQRFGATFGRSLPLDRGAEAPPLLHFCLCLQAAPAAALSPDGHPARGGFLPPVPLPRRMWAGGALTFHAPIRIGDEVIRRSTVRDVTLREGRSGTLCFVTVEHRIDSAGRLAVQERQDIVFRGAEAAAPSAARGGPAAAPAPAPRSALRRQMAVPPTLLFRYSALTFNAHRIHYDRPYALGEEGYPGLVVHGPLQATLLALFAQDVRGRPPAAFEFRSQAPVFDTAEVTLDAEDGPDGALRLWTAQAGGPVAMAAQARWDDPG